MDWPVTEDYCREFGQALNLQIFLSWRVGGFEREMLRHEARTAPVRFETLDHSVEERGGERGTVSTRRRFPQVSASLQTRWCSSTVKIDVASVAINNQARFANGRRYLVVTGERAEESPARSRYAVFETHRTDNRNGRRVRRWMDHWRPVLHWDEKRVWYTLQAHRVRPHPAYYCGWSRTSCMCCIFGGRNQWATVRSIAPESTGKTPWGAKREAQTVGDFLVELSTHAQAHDAEPESEVAAMIFGMCELEDGDVAFAVLAKEDREGRLLAQDNLYPITPGGVQRCIDYAQAEADRLGLKLQMTESEEIEFCAEHRALIAPVASRHGFDNGRDASP
jgi:3'-phosphoadenosine 5'-phosphosulfate sulfotransferase (PAPS reductase)/FAD synthetase